MVRVSGECWADAFEPLVGNEQATEHQIKNRANGRGELGRQLLLMLQIANRRSRPFNSQIPFARFSRSSPNLVVSNLVVCNSYAEALFCALLHPFVLFCGLLRTCVCTLLRSFALLCSHLRIRGNGPLMSENIPIRKGNAPLALMGSFRAPRHGGKRPL